MREWPNRTVSKTVVSQGTVGSNPTPSARSGVVFRFGPAGSDRRPSLMHPSQACQRASFLPRQERCASDNRASGDYAFGLDETLSRGSTGRSAGPSGLPVVKHQTPCWFSETESVPGPSGAGSLSHRARHLGRSVLGVTRHLAGRQPPMQTGGIGVHAIHDVELLPMFVGDTDHVALELDGQRCGDVLALVECGLGHLGPPPQGAVRFLQYVSRVAEQAVVG